MTGCANILNKRGWGWGASACLCSVLISFNAKSAPLPLAEIESETNILVFRAKGVVEAIKPEDKVIFIKHEAISNYMEAMTMPFKVKETKELLNAQTGAEILFRLHVAKTESWVDQIVKVGMALPEGNVTTVKSLAVDPPTAPSTNPLLDYKFTNELGKPVSLNDFRGQALAITFFYTRCPLPDYCPRLSRNFQEASQKLVSMTNAPLNWHFLSFSFDTEIDSPAMLKSYGESYGYDPGHWSFLTGPADKISELARSSGATYEFVGGIINHNFRTLIVDAAGHLQMIFPTGGNLSDQIVEQILKAAIVTNQTATVANQAVAQQASPRE
jgi:protein SCO1